MKFADLEVGKSYKNSSPGVKRVVFKTDKYVVLESDLPYPTIYDNIDNNFKNWVEVKRVKLYCGIFYNYTADSSFIVCRDSQENLDIYKKAISFSSHWKLIREYTEEFNTV